MVRVNVRKRLLSYSSGSCIYRLSKDYSACISWWNVYAVVDWSTEGHVTCMIPVNHEGRRRNSSQLWQTRLLNQKLKSVLVS